MPTPFADPDSFTGVTPQGVGMISTVVHSTVLSVDEGGVEAAAATGIVTDEGGDGEELPEIVFRADRPFMVMIDDRPTRSVLFLGRVVDP